MAGTAKIYACGHQSKTQDLRVLRNGGRNKKHFITKFNGRKHRLQLRKSVQFTSEFSNIIQIHNGTWLDEQNPNKKEKISEHILNEITTLSYSEMQTIIDCMDNHDVKINDAFIK